MIIYSLKKINFSSSLKTGIFRKYPSQTWYLFNYTEYYLEHWLNK
jgi:hypothetical protein